MVLGKKIRLLKAKDILALTEFCSRVEKLLQGHLKTIKLFGSKARQEDQADSDIDILIVLDKIDRRIRNSLIDVAFDVNLDYGVYISPRIIPEKILHDPLWSETHFIRNSFRKGIRLW
jgi:predicted nucleotidyltransferase